VFETLGYRRCAFDPSRVAAAEIEQIALYAYSDIPGCSHAARQLPNAVWVSKINDLPGVAHVSPTDLEGGQGYGRVVEYMARPR
jgi:hypothetical protein